MLHLGYFVDLLRENGSLSDDMLDKIAAFVEKTSDSAWTKSAVWPPFDNVTDACNTGPANSAVKYPKFYWWWGENATAQMIPPDPRLYIHKTQLRCYTHNNSQILEGLFGSEQKCMEKCMRYKNCSKYLYQTDQQCCPWD